MNKLTQQYLSGLTIIDLSHRLPGPFCGKILNDLGAKVIKIEDEKFQDPFSSGLFAQFDKSFLYWYENLNSHKQILRFDFNNTDDQQKIRDLVLNSDAVIMGLPESTRKKIKLLDSDLELQKPFVTIELLASLTNKKSMHDLNALAETNLLSLYVSQKEDDILDPPFLPIAGISFGHKAATDLLAAYIKSLRENKSQSIKTYLDQSTEDIYGLFWPQKDRDQQRMKFLHNGQYPCYSIYRTKDGEYIALAAVEEKFWNRFVEVFKIETKKDRFYNETPELFLEISKCIKKFNQKEIEALTKNEDICLSLI